MSMFGTLVDSLATSFTLRSGVERGYLFRARYRVKNVIGWSDYSPIGYILSAVKPSIPPQPAIVKASATNIAISILPSEDNGGTIITSY